MTASAVGVGAAAFVDLHAHSTASDGSRSPADVVRQAKRVGLAAIALTDHDTLDGIAEAVATGLELGVRVVPGVELSAVENDVETHILGLHLSDTRRLEAELVALREMRRSRATRIVSRLNELGVRIEFASVLEQAAGGAIGRRLTPMLVAAGHHVVGTTRAPDKADALARLGAEPVVLDVFDVHALTSAMVAAKPDAVIHQLTDLAAPRAGGVDDVFRQNRTSLGLDPPLARGQALDAEHGIVADDLGAARARAGRHGVGGERGIDMAVIGLEHRADDAVGDA